MKLSGTFRSALALSSALIHVLAHFQGTWCKGNMQIPIIFKRKGNYPLDLKIIWSSAHFSTNKADRHDISEILLKVALNTIILILAELQIIFKSKG
jgi:nucleoside recognition membrane protein YjiH